jgi:hypothetical protein
VPQRANSTRVSYSYRQMSDALLQKEKVERAVFNELLEIGKYRNLVFHGHVAEVRAGMLKRVRAPPGASRRWAEAGDRVGLRLAR